MFHGHNDDVTQQAQHSRVGKQVADQQSPGTSAERLERPFLQLFRHSGRQLTKFENVSNVKDNSYFPVCRLIGT